MVLFASLLSFAAQTRAQSAIHNTDNNIRLPINSAVCQKYYYPGYSDVISRIAYEEYRKYYQHSFRDNKTPYNNYNGEPWCASFAVWVYQKAGFSVPSEPLTTRSRGLIELFAANGIARGKTTFFTEPEWAAPGDIIVWKRNVDGQGHTGIVIENDCRNRIVKTIEGNAEGGQIRAVSYTYSGINTRFKIEGGTQGGFSLYGFGRWVQ